VTLVKAIISKVHESPHGPRGKPYAYTVRIGDIVTVQRSHDAERLDGDRGRMAASLLDKGYTLKPAKS
jgi:hypothetical protein